MYSLYIQQIKHLPFFPAPIHTRNLHNAKCLGYSNIRFVKSGTVIKKIYRLSAHQAPVSIHLTFPTDLIGQDNHLYIQEQLRTLHPNM